ncbi:MAG TPA: MMPL family transporter, partial [Streptosporangiaceae bacterium]
MTNRTGTQDSQSASGADRGRSRPGGGLFAALGRMVTQHPWLVIGAWIIAAVAVIATAPALPTTSNEASFLPSSYESIRAQNLQDQAFPQAGHVDATAAIIVFARSGGQPLTSADKAKVASVASTLNSKHIANILRVTAGPVSPNGLVQTAAVAMDNSIVNGSGTQAGDAVKALRSDIRPLMTGSGLYEGITGAAAQQLDSQQSGNKAEAIVLLATLLLILILLLIIFRSPIVALMPIITIAIVAEVAQGLIADVNSALNLNANSETTVILIVVLFGIGTDYILFLMFRYRERLRAGDSPKQAVATAVERVGEVIASAAGVVIVAFLALLLSSLSIFRSLGPTLAIAVAVTLIAALTLIPAVATLLGTRVFWPSKSWQREPEGARFAAIGRALGRRPAVFAGVAGLVLVALAVGSFSFNPTFDLSSAGIPSKAESEVALHVLEKGLPPGATDPTQVFLHATSGTLTAAQVTGYGAKLKT